MTVKGEERKIVGKGTVVFLFPNKCPPITCNNVQCNSVGIYMLRFKIKQSIYDLIQYTLFQGQEIEEDNTSNNETFTFISIVVHNV